MYHFSRKRALSIGNYILWIAAEVVSLAAVYVLLQLIFISRSEDILASYKESLKITTLVLLLPYSISYLYFSWLEKNKKIEQLSESRKTEKPVIPAFIPFKDERGELRFSIKTGDLLYLEAADNYVVIHYLDGKLEGKFMIRNSLKSLERELSEFGVIRCHRSYMVNFARVKIIRKEKDGLVLEIDAPDRKNLPISDTYVREVMSMFSGFTD
jgi:DNA-binding LytR/AlgR family response regulator